MHTRAAQHLSLARMSFATLPPPVNDARQERGRPPLLSTGLCLFLSSSLSPPTHATPKRTERVHTIGHHWCSSSPVVSVFEFTRSDTITRAPTLVAECNQLHNSPRHQSRVGEMTNASFVDVGEKWRRPRPPSVSVTVAVPHFLVRRTHTHLVVNFRRSFQVVAETADGENVANETQIGIKISGEKFAQSCLQQLPSLRRESSATARVREKTYVPVPRLFFVCLIRGAVASFRL